MEKRAKPLTRRLKILSLTLAALLGAALLWGIAVEPSLLTVSEIEFTDGRLPKELDGVRIVFIADVHAGPDYPPPAVERLAKRIESLRPDMLLFGGDLLEREDTALVLDKGRVARAFANLKPRLGKYAIYGNHDIWTPKMKGIASEILSDGGFAVLENGAAKVAEGFYVAGTAPWPMGGQKDPGNHADPGSVAWTARNGAFSLLLAHEPAQIRENSKFPFAFQLSGHTHGGQVALPFRGPIRLPSGLEIFKSGFYQIDKLKMYVTRGIGTSVIRLRLFVPPEIVVVTLRKE